MQLGIKNLINRISTINKAKAVSDEKLSETYWKVFSAATFFLLLLILYQTTLTIDALITFRVIDNFVHGYGLRWNIAERVQAYTNPLWMLLHIPLYALWENIIFVTVFLSVISTFIALWLTAFSFKRRWTQLVALFFIPLAISPTFVIFATCGLEAPLTIVLFCAFGWALLKESDINRWFFISFFVSLSLVNRLDEVIFYFPVCFYLLISRFRRIRWNQCLLGSIPIVLWVVFSLFYYGFIFPNTKYAKLNTGIPSSDYIRHGVLYLKNMLLSDCSSGFLLLVVAVGVPVYRLILQHGKATISSEMLCIALGILSYSAYVVYVGGDYMAWHYWSLPVFASIWWLYAVFSQHVSDRTCVCIGLCLVIFRLMYPHYQLVMDGPWRFGAGIQRQSGGSVVLRDYLTKGVSWPAINRREGPGLAWGDVIPIYGWQHGPHMHLIDDLGLADPLLARLPSDARNISIVGHYKRSLPQGYVEMIRPGKSNAMDPDLQQYYLKLRHIVSGDLMDITRWRDIILFNLGQYDYLRDRYVEKHHLNPV